MHTNFLRGKAMYKKMLFFVIFSISLGFSTVNAQVKSFYPEELNSRDIEQIECNGLECLVVPVGTVVLTDQDTEDLQLDYQEEDWRTPPWRRKPKPEDPATEPPKDTPSPEPKPEPPATIEDEFLFPILGRIFWRIVGMPSVQLILTIVGLGLLSQSVMKPIYGEAWVKGLLEDAITQVKGVFEAIFEAFSSKSDSESKGE